MNKTNDVRFTVDAPENREQARNIVDDCKTDLVRSGPTPDVAGLVEQGRKASAIVDSYTGDKCLIRDLTDCVGALAAEVTRLKGLDSAWRQHDLALEAAEAEAAAWRERESETQEALQKIGEEFGIHGGEPRVDGLLRALRELRAEAAALRAEVERLRKVDKSCRWYWPEDDTGSEACADSPSEVVENAYGWGTPTGEVVAVARGGVVEVTYCAALSPAPDADSDDEFWVEEATTEAAAAKIAAELERRSALGKAESPNNSKAGG